ncbi:MAG TPA: DUF4242 domain-containing protein [Chloroflexota bacterium]
MPLYMDVHKRIAGVSPDALIQAHKKDLETQDKYGVKYHRYYLDKDTETVFCLVEAPSKEAAERVHREAHGLVADEIHEVTEGS